MTAELRRMGLRVGIRHQVVPGRRAGTVVGITPSGEVPAGTTVIVYAARTPPSPSLSSRADNEDRTGGLAPSRSGGSGSSEHKSKGKVKANGKGHGKKG